MTITHGFRNTFKQRMNARELLLGLWNNMSSPAASEIVSSSPFEFICIDCEHAPNDYAEVLEQLRAIASTHCAPVVRPAWNDMIIMKRLLDIGVTNFIVPHIESAEEAAAAVRFTRYPPEGVRGMGGASRANGYGRQGNYANEANDSICVMALVETRLGIENLSDIAATDGIDAIVIGANDLAADLGYLGQPYHPEVVGLVESGIARTLGAGKIVVSVATSQEHVRRYSALGCTMFIVGTDTAILARAVDQKAAEFAFLKSSRGGA